VGGKGGILLNTIRVSGTVGNAKIQFHVCETVFLKGNDQNLVLLYSIWIREPKRREKELGVRGRGDLFRISNFSQKRD